MCLYTPPVTAVWSSRADSISGRCALSMSSQSTSYWSRCVIDAVDPVVRSASPSSSSESKLLASCVRGIASLNRQAPFFSSHRGRAPVLLLISLRCLNSSVVRVSPAAHNNSRNRGILDVCRNVSPYRSQPSLSYFGFLRKQARKHVPLQLTHLATVRPGELVTKPTDKLSRLSTSPQLDPSVSREPLVNALSNSVRRSVGPRSTCRHPNVCRQHLTVLQ